MTRSQLTAIVRGLIPTVREYVSGAMDAVHARIKALEERALIAGPAGKDGTNGKDADVKVIEELTRAVQSLKAQIVELKSAPVIDLPAVIRETVAAMPTPKDGAPGANGKDADPTVLQALRDEIAALKKDLATVPRTAPSVDIEAIVATVLQRVPTPTNGTNGKDADPEHVKKLVREAVAALPAPKDGTSVTAADVAPLIADEVHKAVSALPPAKNGVDGAKGKDGIGVAGALIDKSGSLVVTLSDGTVASLGRVVGSDGQKGEPGKDGAPGVDGLGWDDFEETFDGERTVTRTYRKGDQVKTFTFTFPCVIYRGVFVDGHAYAKGDGVTWAGSYWIAVEDTSAKPGLVTPESRAWKLAVKSGSPGKEGRPGKDGKDGERGPVGPKGERGYGG